MESCGKCIGTGIRKWMKPIIDKPKNNFGIDFHVTELELPAYYASFTVNQH